MTLTDLFGHSVRVDRLNISGVRAGRHGTIIYLRPCDMIFVHETPEKVVELWFQVI